jgi:hypothetical protein
MVDIRVKDNSIYLSNSIIIVDGRKPFQRDKYEII